MRLLVLSALLVSFSALACPDLSGTYATCRSGNGESYDLVISQTLQNRITTYSITSTDPETYERRTEVYRADGRINSQTITDPESGVTFTMSSVVRCVNNTLNMNTKVAMSGEQVANVTIVINKSGKALTAKTTGTSFGETVSDTMICE